MMITPLRTHVSSMFFCLLLSLAMAASWARVLVRSSLTAMREVDEEDRVDKEDYEAHEGGGRAGHLASGNSFLASIRNSFFLTALNFSLCL